jgi:hypothetical protein
VEITEVPTQQLVASRNRIVNIACGPAIAGAVSNKKIDAMRRSVKPQCGSERHDHHLHIAFSKKTKRLRTGFIRECSEFI